MCENHTSTSDVLEQSIKVKDISNAVLDMPSPRGFLKADEKNAVVPRYAKSIKALYLIMHWPLISEDNSKLDESTGVSETGLSLYGAVVQHGKTHIAEVFFANEKTQSYQGSHKVFSIDFPNNIYLEEYDDWLMDDLANRVLGVKHERTLGHDIVH